MTADPVCRMLIDPAEALSAEHAGETYWFCSLHCRDEFSADPGHFLGGAVA